MTDLHPLISTLEQASFLSDEEKKQWFEQAKNMPQELVDILIKALTANSQEEFDALKERIVLRKKELKEYADHLMTEGIQKIYKEAESLSADDEASKQAALLAQAEEA